ncbi:MAG: chemotaxis protein CheA [Pseudomonadota bacterium]
MDDLLADFVAETREMLEASEGEIIAWEANPADTARVDAIFRFVHTVKGNCGFFDFPRLADLSHAAEDTLADCRAGRRAPDAPLVSAVLAIIDRIVEMVDAIEADGACPDGDDSALIAALEPGAKAPIDDADTVVDTGVDTGPDTAPNPEDEGADTASPSPSPAAVQRTIRLPVDLLDRVMSGVSDMVLARNDLAHRLRQAGNQPTIDGPFERLTSILTDVRDAITRMRMQRIETLFSALPRLVRDLSNELGKQAVIEIEGGDVELDREMIEMIRDPLTHILRNAIDHGLEEPAERAASGKNPIGTITMAARQSGNKISIVVTDDGRGLNEAKICQKAIAQGLLTAEQADIMNRDAALQLVFEPGLSTASEVSAVSGRGVGLDVVRDNLERVGGSIKVTSTPGRGSLFYLQIPLTLSIISGLTVEVGGQRFAIPQSYVEEAVDLSASAIEYTKAGETALVTFRDQRIPCLSMAEVLGLEATLPDDEAMLVMLRLASGDLFAVAVDAIHTINDLVVKPLPRTIMNSELYGGSTLLDDGHPILVLDMPLIALNQGLVSETRSVMPRRGANDTQQVEKAAQRAMLFTDFAGRRHAIRLELVKRIETAPVTAIDTSGSAPRIVIDGLILPLIGLPQTPLESEKVRLLRLSDGACEVLYAVREVDDAVALDHALKPVTDDPLVEAVTLVAGKTVSLIDGHNLFALYGEPPELLALPRCSLPENDWASTILAPLVETAGYEIVSKADADPDTLAIWFEDEYEIARELAHPIADKVIRLRDNPVAPPSSPTIYRYDRDALLEALRAARAGEAA